MQCDHYFWLDLEHQVWLVVFTFVGLVTFFFRLAFSFSVKMIRFQNHHFFFHQTGKTADKNEVEADLALFVRRHSSMDTSNIYNKNKPRVSIALSKVKEEETSES